MNEGITKLEICVDDLVGLHAAVSGGADRIELCSALALGGLTPSPALAVAALQTGVPIHAMVRPRAGDFAYDEDEVRLVVEDIRRLCELGVAGVVVGATNSNGELDENALSRFREASADRAIVLHRAVDLTPDPIAAASTAADLGFDYILTSGGAARVLDGALAIRRMIEKTRGRLTIIAGGGVTPGNVADLVRESGVTQIHSSASRAEKWRDKRVEEFGFAPGPRRVTEAARVAALKRAIAGI